MSVLCPELRGKAASQRLLRPVGDTWSSGCASCAPAEAASKTTVSALDKRNRWYPCTSPELQVVSASWWDLEEKGEE